YRAHQKRPRPAAGNRFQDSVRIARVCSEAEISLSQAGLRLAGTIFIVMAGNGECWSAERSEVSWCRERAATVLTTAPYTISAGLAPGCDRGRNYVFLGLDDVRHPEKRR